jgi:Flp pilus assembly protein TadB
MVEFAKTGAPGKRFPAAAEKDAMDSSAERPQSRPQTGSFYGLATLVGAVFTVIAAVVATVLAVAVATSVVVIALVGGALLFIASLAARARRVGKVAKARREEPQIIEARNVGGHSWVAYGWNERP